MGAHWRCVRWKISPGQGRPSCRLASFSEVAESRGKFWTVGEGKTLAELKTTAREAKRAGKVRLTRCILVFSAAGDAQMIKGGKSTAHRALGGDSGTCKAGRECGQQDRKSTQPGTQADGPCQSHASVAARDGATIAGGITSPSLFSRRRLVPVRRLAPGALSHRTPAAIPLANPDVLYLRVVEDWLSSIQCERAGRSKLFRARKIPTWFC